MIASPHRQLSAIMFTDIVGYTAIMQEDETKAIAIRQKHRQVFEASHEQHHGKIIQYYGDGTLSVFKSAIEATECAISIQKALQADDIIIPLRIGLHIGDITFDHTEVYGDGVNITSRIESMGIAGTILLSEQLNTELKNHPSISTASLGSFTLKNVEDSIEIFAIHNDGIVLPQPHELKGTSITNDQTIAVLPFANMSHSENEYFSDGITEEIINALAKIEQIKVTSRTSSFTFKGKNLPISIIGQQLGVGTILEGSIRIAGEMIRITAQLIQVKDDFHFWSETWDRKLENIFDLQDEISLLIAEKLREHFGHFEINEQLVTPPTEDKEAYDFCLQAKYLENKWNPQDTQKAISFYIKALEIDTNYVDALVGLANCYSFLGTIGTLPFEESWSKTIEYTQQAYTLSRDSAPVYYQLSNQAFFVECDYKKSLDLIQKAIQLHPSYADAHQFISFLYTLSDQHERAFAHIQIATSINPLSEETHFFKAYYHYMTHDYELALKMLDQCLEKNDKNIPAHAIKPLCLLQLGKYTEVIHYYDSVPQEIGSLGERTGPKALAYSFLNDKVNTEKYRQELMQQAQQPDGFTADSYLFFLYTVLGEHEKAFKWVESAFENKSSLVLLRYPDPVVSSLRKDARFTPLQRQLYTISPVLKKTTKKPLLDATLAQTYTQKLVAYFNESSPYLNANLSLRSLANELEIHPNQLSWVLNDSLGKNFNEFVNQYRIEHFKSLAHDKSYAHYTIMGLALESGFNSKTVFNTYFKKSTGLTPKQYLQQ